VPAATLSPTSSNNTNNNNIINSNKSADALEVAIGNDEQNMSQSFDQLKREAVRLERSLEDKVARYQQVCTTLLLLFLLYCAVLII
jgi:Golgi SNAP receptor complex protein 1